MGRDGLVCQFRSSLQKGDCEVIEVDKITGGLRMVGDLQGANPRRCTHSYRVVCTRRLGVLRGRRGLGELQETRRGKQCQIGKEVPKEMC